MRANKLNIACAFMLTHRPFMLLENYLEINFYIKTCESAENHKIRNNGGISRNSREFYPIFTKIKIKNLHKALDDYLLESSG